MRRPTQPYTFYECSARVSPSCLPANEQRAVCEHVLKALS
jgi:hypothetical protein